MTIINIYKYIDLRYLKDKNNINEHNLTKIWNRTIYYDSTINANSIQVPSLLLFIITYTSNTFWTLVNLIWTVVILILKTYNRNKLHEQ